MPAININQLKLLRQETGVSFSLCSKALTEANNDLDKARKLLTKWGVEKTAGKLNRETKQGAIFSYVHHNGKIATLVELLCETDFVAVNADFKALGADLAMQIASTNPTDTKNLLASPYIKDESKKIEELVREYILKIGENIKINKFIRFEI